MSPKNKNIVLHNQHNYASKKISNIIVQTYYMDFIQTLPIVQIVSLGAKENPKSHATFIYHMFSNIDFCV